MITLELNTDLIWQSDWGGDEVGFPDVLIVGLYQLKGSAVFFYIDIEEMVILDAWGHDDLE